MRKFSVLLDEAVSQGRDHCAHSPSPDYLQVMTSSLLFSNHIFTAGGSCHKSLCHYDWCQLSES
uniref:Uncharacterized protein n=1 Tax=Arion vulgaris TaxID=1028688 RepID=A0A0B7AZC6_9EUPU